MSTDIAGWVEIKRNDKWFGVIDILPIINRNYAMFDFLFGGRNDNYESAIAGNRGVPEDVSKEAQYGETWIGLDEIQAIAWEEHENIFTHDWKSLFQIMVILAKEDFIQDVRLIVGFF